MLSSPHGLRTKLVRGKSYLVLIELPLLSNFVTSRHLFGSKEVPEWLSDDVQLPGR